MPGTNLTRDEAATRAALLDVTAYTVDLPGGTTSGLRQAESILGSVDDLAFCHLTAHDVVRHKLVGRIVAAYEVHDAAQPPPVARR